MALLTVRQAALELGVKSKTLRYWLAQRRIAYVKLGYVIRIQSSEIERLIRESTVSALPAKPVGRRIQVSTKRQ